MYRKFISLLLLWSFTMQLFGQGIYYLGYYLNRAAYVKNCENRARPQLHCNGQCLLMKKMRAADKQDQQYPAMKQVDKAEIHSSRSFFATIDIPVREIFQLPALYRPQALGEYSGSVFRPPGSDR